MHTLLMYLLRLQDPGGGECHLARHQGVPQEQEHNHGRNAQKQCESGSASPGGGYGLGVRWSIVTNVGAWPWGSAACFFLGWLQKGSGITK